MVARASGFGLRPCSSGPITTRRCAHWPTNWPAFAMACCATRPRSASPRDQALASSGNNRSHLLTKTLTTLPPRCTETFRPSWPHRSHHNPVMPITLPAHPQPLVAIGTALADSMTARANMRSTLMPDIRLHAFPTRHPCQQRLALLGGVHIRRVRRHYRPGLLRQPVAQGSVRWPRRQTLPAPCSVRRCRTFGATSRSCLSHVAEAQA